MHIALLSPAWPLEKHQNGIVTYVHWMKQELERLGHRVSVFAGRSDPSVRDPRVHIVQRGLGGLMLRRVARPLFPIERDIFGWGTVVASAILDVHRREPIDIVEMEESFGWCADVARITSIPVLVKLHGPAFLSLIDDELDTSMGRERVEREGRALARAAAIASPTRATLTQTIERYALAPAVRQHIVNPLTMDADTPVWRLDTCDRNTILFVGRFDKRKGADVMLQSFELLLRHRADLKLVFVGPDSGLLQVDGSRIHFEPFRDSLVPVALRDRVEFLGRMPNRDISQLRTRAMVTVVASRWENQGYTALEAMFQGCPVVCSDVGGCPESIVHGKTGRLARSGDPVDFAAQLAATLDDPLGAAAMGAAARQYVIEIHSAGKVAGDSLDLYRRVIALEHQRTRPRTTVA